MESITYKRNDRGLLLFIHHNNSRRSNIQRHSNCFIDEFLHSHQYQICIKPRAAREMVIIMFHIKDLGLNSEEQIIYNRLIWSTYYNQENNDRHLFSFLQLDWVFPQRIGNRLAMDYFSSMHYLKYTGRALMENRC